MIMGKTAPLPLRQEVKDTSQAASIGRLITTTHCYRNGRQPYKRWAVGVCLFRDPKDAAPIRIDTVILHVKQRGLDLIRRFFLGIKFQ